jgi:hypothetical protein
MKLNSLFLAGLVALGGAVSAQAQAVYSINTVGYVNLDIPAGFSMISNPLDAGDNTIGNVLSSVPDGTVVYKFNAGSGSYSISTAFGGTFFPDGSITLAPGEGVFINAPSAFSVTFSGEVMQGELSNPLPAGFSIVSSQVPQEGSLQALGYTGTDGDVVYQFSNSSGTYSINTYFGGSFFPSEPNVGIGEAFFVNKASAGSWDRNFSTDQ